VENRSWVREEINMRLLRLATWLLLCLLAALAVPVVSYAQVICVSNVSPPPELPVYEQPPIPAPGYLWIPGYWASGPSGYFWVPGTWTEPPAVGLLWTPGYWGWRDGIYVWNAGYWGPHIGFYGGINYGFGYVGVGYEGGRWENGVFAYNRTVNNFGGVRITNVYEKTVIVEPGARVSFQGGTGGTTVRPTPAEEAAAHDQHVAASPAQLQQERTASADKNLLASENHGQPAVAATAKPGEFTGKGVVAAKEEKPTSAIPGSKPGAVGTVAPNANAPIPADKKEPAAKPTAKPAPGTPPQPASGETKPSIAAKPPGIEPKPNVEAKPKIEAKPNAEAKPNTEVRPSTEAKKPPNITGKPEAKLPAGASPKPAPDAKPALRAAAAPKPGAGPQAKPAPKNKKPD
jgi:WXXGXW repeat (2 copies)